MPQFNLSSATISTTFIEDILYPFTGYVPFVYDDMYPSLMTDKQVREDASLTSSLTDPSGNVFTHWYYETEPYNTSVYNSGNVFYKRYQNYKHSNFGTYGKVPFNPDLHSFVNGTLKIGLGTTPDLINKVASSTISNAYRHGQGLYTQVYNTGIEISGTTYTFPISFGATVGSGGFWYPKSGSGNGTQVTNANTNFKYTGDNSADSLQVFSYTHAKNLANDVLTGTNGIVDEVRAMMAGNEDSFPYDNTLAQEHFDIMCLIAYVKGVEVLKQSHFLHQYKQCDGTSVTSSSDLDEYERAAYQLPWFAVAPVVGAINYRFSWSLTNKLQKLINLMLTSSQSDTTHGLTSIVTPLDGSSDNYTGITLNPDWYAGGPEITTDFMFAPKDYKSGDYQTINKIPPGSSPSFKLLSTAVGGQSNIPWTPAPVDINDDGVIDILDVIGISVPALPTVDFWENDKFDLDAFIDEVYASVDEPLDVEQGDENYYKLNPHYQAYYAAYWQDASSYFHGNTAHSGKPAASKHGAVLASTAENQLPAFIIGLNENGNGVSKVYMRSTLSVASVTNSVTSAYDIADGKTLGTIDYGQWNHFAITRKGNTFKTFKNGVQQDTWDSSEDIKFPVQNTSSYIENGLDLSIGRSQGNDYFYGYIDGLRYTKGEALYTSDFTTPTSAPTIESTQSNYYGKHHIETVQTALQKLSTQLDVEYKLRIGTAADDTTRPVSGGTNLGKLLIDVGPRESLFTGHSSDPTSIIVRDGSGDDPSITGLNPSAIKSSFDASEYASLVEYIYDDGKGKYDALDVFDTNNPYRGINGEQLERATYVTEPEHPHLTRKERATAYLNELKRIKRSINLDLDYYDIQGDFEVGDNIFVYDPDLGFEDTDDKVAEDEDRTTKHEVSYQGQFINPEKIRVTAITWPIKNNYGVYLRRLTSAKNNTYQYIDLTEYVQFESAGTTLEVGDLPLKLGDDLRFSSAVSGISTGNRTYTPESVSNLSLTTGFIEDATGESQAIIKATWDEPLNTDGTVIQNGEFYRVRYKKQNSNDPYSITTVNWGTEEITIEGLGLATDFEVGVQAVNTNADTNDYTTAFITTAIDTVAPNKPGPADTITPGALRTQIVHSLGKAVDDSGNAILPADIVDFTLPNDIAHFNIYYSTTSGFSISGMEPKETFAISASHIRAQIPLVCEIALPNGSQHYFRFTVTDKAGNESDPSDEQGAAGQLVDTQHVADAFITNAKIGNLAVTDAKIADLSAGKLTAGTITSQEITLGQDSSDSAVIKSSNYSGGTAGWKISADGTIEANSGNFRGDITGASGTFSGALSAATGTFAGSLSAASGTFTGNISANQITADTLNLNRIPSGIQAKIDAAGITATELAANAVTEAKIAAGAIVEAKLADGSVSNAKLGNISADKITTGTMSADRISGGSISGDVISGGTITFGSSIMTTNQHVLTGLVTISPTLSGSVLGTQDSNTTIRGGYGTFDSFNVDGNATIDSTLSVSQVKDRYTSTIIDFATSYIDLKPAGNLELRINNNSQISAYDDIRPVGDGSYQLGSSSNRWSAVYRINAYSTSDERLKENIVDLDKGLDFVNDLIPKEFTWKEQSFGFFCSSCDEEYDSIDDICNTETENVDEEGSNVVCSGEIRERKNHGIDTTKKVYGFLAQDIEPLLDNSNDYSLLHYNSDDDEYIYSQENLIAPLVKAVQEISTQISDLTDRIEALEG